MKLEKSEIMGEYGQKTVMMSYFYCSGEIYKFFDWMIETFFLEFVDKGFYLFFLGTIRPPDLL